MPCSFFSRRAALIFTAILFLTLTGVSGVRAEGYQVSQNLQPGQTLTNYRVSSDGRYAVYQIDQYDADYNQISQLFSVNLANKDRKTLTPAIGGSGKNLDSYQLTPDGLSVVYIASLEADAYFRSELYSIPIAATSQSQRKNIGNIPSNSEADVRSFYISPDSRHVVYQTSEENANYEEFDILFRVAPNGGAVTQLTPRVADGRASEVIFAPDSSRIVYQYDSPANENTLYQSVSTSGTGRKTLTDRVYGDGKVITPDSKRFVFQANLSPGSDEVGLYSITLAGSETRKQLSKPGEEVYTFKFSNGYPVVVYTFRLTASPGYSPTAFGFVAADKSFESVSYNTGKELDYYNFAVSPDNRAVVYIAGGYGAAQLYSLTYQNNAPIEQQLSVAATGQATFNSVSDFKIAPNSQRVVFRAAQGTASAPDLYSALLTTNNPVAVKLNALPGETSANADYYGVNSYFITPNSARVIFSYPPIDGSSGANLYTNAVTGGTPSAAFATGVNDDPYGNVPVLTADARRVVYTKTVYDANYNAVTTLWTALVP